MQLLKPIFIFLVGCPAFLYAQQAVPIKKEFVLDEKIGDLDRDGVEEKVTVVSLPDSPGKAMIRELRVFKKYGWDWKLWTSSVKAILPFQEGGTLGDPFEYIEIDRGILYIRQSGGNAWKWGQTDKYRFQRGAFELIGYTSFYGRPCEYWAGFDFNIAARKVIYKKEYENCSLKKEKSKKEQENFKYRLKKKITLENRYESYTTITSPKLKQEIVF